MLVDLLKQTLFVFVWVTVAPSQTVGGKCCAVQTQGGCRTEEHKMRHFRVTVSETRALDTSPVKYSPRFINLSEVCLFQTKPRVCVGTQTAAALRGHVYLRQRLHDGVQESSHPFGHLQKLQHCRETRGRSETS